MCKTDKVKLKKNSTKTPQKNPPSYYILHMFVINRINVYK